MTKKIYCFSENIMIIIIILYYTIIKEDILMIYYLLDQCDLIFCLLEHGSD